MFVYILIGLTVMMTVCGQLLVKSGSQVLTNMPTEINQIVPFLINALTSIKILLGLLCAVIASITWMGALSRTDISFAYPFMGLAIVLVLALAPILFNETVPWTRWIGVLVVCIGLWIVSR